MPSVEALKTKTRDDSTCGGEQGTRKKHTQAWKKHNNDNDILRPKRCQSIENRTKQKIELNKKLKKNYFWVKLKNLNQ